MLLKNEYVKTLRSDISNNEFTNLLGASLEVINLLVELRSVLVTELEYISEGNILASNVSFIDLQLDKVEDFSMYIPNARAEATIIAGAFKNGGVRKRLAEGYASFLEAYDLATSYAEKYIPLTTEQVIKLREIVLNSLGNLLYGIYYQFDMDITSEQLMEDKLNVDVNVSVHSHASNKGISPENLVITVHHLLRKFKPTLGFFEEYPELEGEFYDAVGVYVNDFLDIEEKLTLNLVKLIIEGKIELTEEFFNSLAGE